MDDLPVTGGIFSVEVTFRVSAAEEKICKMRRHPYTLVRECSFLTKEQILRAADAFFIVIPRFNLTAVGSCNLHGIFYITHK